MRLFVDIGNTAVKWTTDVSLQSDSVERRPIEPSLQAMFTAWESYEQPDGVYISSVLQAERKSAIQNWVENQWGLKPFWAETRAAELGVKNGYREPTQLGVDRWLALLAARSFFQSPLLVVDCGSATTLDGMDAAGNHLGGVILPGLRLFPQCLIRHTDIPAFGESGTIDYFATDTSAGIYSGAILATISTVERMLGMIKKEFALTPICLLTGGDAEIVGQHLTIEYQREPNLVLQGLALIAAEAKS
jgi:type III pantothenate kinase